MKQNVLHAAFNRGRVSKLAFARDDLQGNRIRFGAEEQTNIIPRVLGSSMLAPGWRYINTTRNNQKAVNLRFEKKSDDTAILEFTDSYLRVKVDESPVTRVAVSTAIFNSAMLAYVTNGTFDADASWTKGAGWTIAAGVATAVLASSALSQNSAVTLVSGKSYSITYTITRSAGSVVATIGGASGVSRSASGTYTETIVAGATQVIGFTGTGFSGTVDAVTINPTNTGWADADEGSSVSTVASGKINLQGTGFSAAIRKQQVTVSGGDANKEHALRIVIERGPVTFRCGSTDGADDYIPQTSLGEGEHSLAFTPTGDFYIQFSSTRQYTTIIDSCTVEAAGEMLLPTPYLLADLPFIRWQQSEDVVFLACTGYQQRRIERRNNKRSWSVVLYQPEDGPFRVVNTGITRLTPSAINGDITLTASRSLFRSTHVGALFQMTSVGQLVESSISGEDQWSDPIRVIGTAAQREFTYTISGTWSGTVKIQRSAESPGSWVDVAGLSFTGNSSSTYRDGLSNQIIYYRIGIKTGGYTSGTVSVSLEYASGGITGVVRITAVASETSASAVVLKTLGGTGSSAIWREGEWSQRRGYPSAVVLDGGRLSWSGKGKFIGSISDAYDSFDPDFEGDAGPINRSIPASSAETVNWMLSLERLVLGTPSIEVVIRSSTLDEPLTPSLFNPKAPSDCGSANIPAVKLGTSGFFVGKSLTKLIEMKFGADGTSDYSTAAGDLFQICPEIGLPGLARIEVQRNPDKRFHCLRTDGTVVILILDEAEDVKCLVEVETDGQVEDILVMPGTVEDTVYYWVKRTVDGQTVRYMERWAMEADCHGGTFNQLAHSFVIYDGAATDTIPVPHLEGKQVIVWAEGRDFSPLDAERQPRTYTVTGGVITLDEEVETAVVGLFYRGRFKSTKLAYAGQLGTALLQRKRVETVGLLLADTHHKGVYYGPDFETMDCLPQVDAGIDIEDDTIHADREVDMTEFPGDWSSDSRICLEMSAPRPATVVGMVFGIDTHDKG